MALCFEFWMFLWEFHQSNNFNLILYKPNVHCSLLGKAGCQVRAPQAHLWMPICSGLYFDTEYFFLVEINSWSSAEETKHHPNNKTKTLSDIGGMLCPKAWKTCWHKFLTQNFPLWLHPHKAFSGSNGLPVHSCGCSGRHLFKCSGNIAKMCSLIFIYGWARRTSICVENMPWHAFGARHVFRAQNDAWGFCESWGSVKPHNSPWNMILHFRLSTRPSLSHFHCKNHGVICASGVGSCVSQDCWVINKAVIFHWQRTFDPGFVNQRSQIFGVRDGIDDWRKWSWICAWIIWFWIHLRGSMKCVMDFQWCPNVKPLSQSNCKSNMLWTSSLSWSNCWDMHEVGQHVLSFHKWIMMFLIFLDFFFKVWMALGHCCDGITHLLRSVLISEAIQAFPAQDFAFFQWWQIPCLEGLTLLSSLGTHVQQCVWRNATEWSCTWLMLSHWERISAVTSTLGSSFSSKWWMGSLESPSLQWSCESSLEHDSWLSSSLVDHHSWEPSLENSSSASVPLLIDSMESASDWSLTSPQVRHANFIQTWQAFNLHWVWFTLNWIQLKHHSRTKLINDFINLSIKDHCPLFNLSSQFIIFNCIHSITIKVGLAAFLTEGFTIQTMNLLSLLCLNMASTLEKPKVTS